MTRLSLFAIWITLFLFTPIYADVSIEGDKEYAPHTLVKLRVVGADAKAAIKWRVYPSDTIDKADTDRNRLQFAATPGRYRVEVLAIGQSEDGSFYIDESTVDVSIRSCHPPEPSPPGPGPTPPPGPGHGRLDPPNALGQIRFGSAGCTATVIGPRRPDGRWDVLTAAHCIRNNGSKGVLTLRGTSTQIPITAISHHPGPDICWCVTDGPHEDLPYANLAKVNPPPGTKIWHMGYGVDRPGNREDGEVATGENTDGQIRMVLSVSSGDSGGGIFRSDTNEVISTVCCTSGMARRVSMWGGSAERCTFLRPNPASQEDIEEAPDLIVGWSPLPIPIREFGLQDDWTPLPIPLRPAPEHMSHIRKED